MQFKKDILRFQWGEFPAIGIKHFEERRDERTKPNETDIFGQSGLTDEEVLMKCFEILEQEKYSEILEVIAKNKPKHTEFVVAFETDEMAGSASKFYYIFLVFSITIKETAMNGIEKGQEFLSCITIVKDTYKNRKQLAPDTVEHTMCYYRDEGGGEDYFWRGNIPR